MARPTKLADAEVTQRLAALPGWTLEGGKLHRELTFPDFTQAFAFMTDQLKRASQLTAAATAIAAVATALAGCGCH